MSYLIVNHHENSLLLCQHNDAEPQVSPVSVLIANKDGLKRDKLLLKIGTKLCVTLNSTVTVLRINK